MDYLFYWIVIQDNVHKYVNSPLNYVMKSDMLTYLNANPYRPKFQNIHH